MGERREAPIVRYKRLAEEIAISCGIISVFLIFVGFAFVYNAPASLLAFTASSILAIVCGIGIIADVLSRMLIAYMKSAAVRSDKR